MHIQDHRGGLVHPRGLIIVFYAVHDARYIGQHHRRAVAVCNNNFPVVAAGDQLIVGVDLVILARPIEVSFGCVHAGACKRRAHVFEVDAVGRQRRWIGLYAHCGFLPAADAYKTDPVELRNLGRKARIHKVFDLRKRHGSRGDGQSEHGRVGWIRLAVDWRRRQNGRQKTLCRVYRSLYLFLGYVNGDGEIKLQHDHGSASGTGGGHLAQTLHFAELALERRRHRRRHHSGAGSRIKREYLNSRIIDFRQRGNRQLCIADNTDQKDGGHQQRGSYRPQYKWTRRTHCAGLAFVLAGAGVFEITTAALSCNLSKLLLATTSPGLMPVT